MKYSISDPLKDGATSHHLTLRLLFKAILSFKVYFSANAILAIIEILQVKLIDACAFDPLLVGDLYGVTGFQALLGCRVHGVVDVIIVQFYHVPVRKDLYRLHDHLIHSQTVVQELYLKDRLVVLVVDLERGGLRESGSGGFVLCCHRGRVLIVDNNYYLLFELKKNK